MPVGEQRQKSAGCLSIPSMKKGECQCPVKVDNPLSKYITSLLMPRHAGQKRYGIFLLKTHTHQCCCYQLFHNIQSVASRIQKGSSRVRESSAQFSRSVVSDSLRPHELQHARPPCPSPTPGVYSNSCPSSRWCHPANSSSVIPSSSCPQSLPASGSFPMSQLFGQSTGVSASASVLPMNTQDWSPLGWAGWISLQSKGLSRVFCNTTVQKHQFSSAQPSSQSNSHIHTWPLEKP